MITAISFLCVTILLFSWVCWTFIKNIQRLEKVINSKGCNYPTHRTGGIDEYIDNNERRQFDQ